MRKRFSINPFEQLSRVMPDGTEYWSAREIMSHFGYNRWENFLESIERAKATFAGSVGDLDLGFRDVTKTQNSRNQYGPITINVADIHLSRYAAYLVAMNGDTTKTEIQYAQAYFAIKTREREVQGEISEIEERRRLRKRVTESVKNVNDAAKESGVTNFGRFTNKGYEGLYGLDSKGIRAYRGLTGKDKLLDIAGRAELAANEFKNTQTELRLRSETIVGETLACETHKEVGTVVREAMKVASGIYPEDLPVERSLKELPEIKDAPTPLLGGDPIITEKAIQPELEM